MTLAYPPSDRDLKNLTGTSDSSNRLRRFRTNLEQWRVLNAVISCGSFANAADFLHVTQPAISYTISKLEERLGIQLLKVEGRKAKITEAGQVLLERSQIVLMQVLELEAQAESLRRSQPHLFETSKDKARLEIEPLHSNRISSDSH